MDAKQRAKAIQNLLGYCRGRPLLNLGAGRALAPALLMHEWQGPLDDEELRKAMTELLRENLIRCRQLAHSDQPISIDDSEHGKALSEDIKGSPELGAWSILWAYYVCAMSHERMQDLCGWSKRVNQLTLSIGRRRYIEPIIIERERALQAGQVSPGEEDGGEPTSLIETALRQALPLELHAHTPVLAQTLAAIATTSLAPEIGQAAIMSNADLIPLLTALEGHHIQAGQVHITFEQGIPLGDVVITNSGMGNSIRLRTNTIPNSTTINVQPDTKPTNTSYLYLPFQTYAHFVGRSDEVNQVLNALRDPHHKAAICIVGLGGIGKTTLAQEAVQRLYQERLFEHVVWTSAKPERFIAETTIPTHVTNYNFSELLSDIGRQCGRPDIVQLPVDQRREVVKHLLATSRTLIVMDNLETVTDRDRLIDDTIQILGRAKLLITSRHRSRHDQVFTVTLGGLLEEDSVLFLREEGRSRNIHVAMQADRIDLIEIHEVTGGAPLAMKLVVGQMDRQPIKIVLETLQQASTKGQNYEFYRFIYWHSWNLLSSHAKMALVDMSVFPPITGGTVLDVQAISQVETSDFWTAMEQLVTMSLVDKVGNANYERFTLHPLTHYFVLSDITGEWDTNNS